MSILTATYTQGGKKYDVEVISEFCGMAEVNAIDSFPFLHGASHAIIRSSDLTNRRLDELPDDLPIPADPREDDVLDGERLGDAAWYRQVNDLQQVGRGA